jgi:hypothetical protein
MKDEAEFIHPSVFILHPLIRCAGSSSVEERPAPNREAVGSIPTRRAVAKWHIAIADSRFEE